LKCEGKRMGRRSGLLAGDRFVGYGIFTELLVHSDGQVASCRLSRERVREDW
jgi:hypothetical protein